MNSDEDHSQCEDHSFESPEEKDDKSLKDDSPEENDVVIDIGPKKRHKLSSRGSTFTNMSVPQKYEDRIEESEIDFLRKIMKKASCAKKEHINAARKYKRNNNILGTFSHVLSTLAGSAGIGSLLSLKTSDPGFTVLLIISIISLCAAVLSTSQRSLNYESKVATRKNSAANYNSLITEIAQFLSTPGADRKDVEIFTSNITTKINVIDSEQEL